MSKTETEEKHPLLLYVVESNEDLSKTNKKYFDKGRFHGITSGATAVFRQFPNYVGTCWVTTAFSGLLFFMMVLLIMSTISTGGLRVPRCIPKDEISNDTIHLVHKRHADDWDPLEVNLFERIVENYPKYKIHLILIQQNTPRTRSRHERRILEETERINPSSTTTLKASSNLIEEKRTTKIEVKRKKRKTNDFRMSINMSAKRLLDILLHGKSPSLNDTDKLEKTKTTGSVEKTTERVKSLDDLLKIHPNIILDNTTYSHVFYMSPLYAYWPYLNENLRVFAVRVLQLWQYGGISFDLSPTIKQLETNTTNNHPVNKTSEEKTLDAIFNKKLLSFIITEKRNYEKLPSGVVAADDEALHMESKIPCHAFFGEILMNLRRAQDDTTVKDVLQESLKVFCRHSAANKKYCDLITSDK
ncbi:uncharacterized protein LOC108914125 [Anoplophora glabripennis]|uniref:uncharacterized protein LOC108914125 n=1 Tax=Anoplophora glabripennis TaxID=217634 RepID=UPI0008755DD0|nr:uncharacterized protein LOC108914125 [Anoplophora glabripennis]XP_018575361.1 uncharacterized protein LOC108914125 [Anoplophora glabripennis]XP_023311440.1 uncharacterized protein LOC108914125 [Anoplophora glabripennis]